MSLVVLAHWLALGGLPQALHGQGGAGPARRTSSTSTPVYVSLGALFPKPSRRPQTQAATEKASSNAPPQGQNATPPGTQSGTQDPTDEAFFGIAGMVDEDSPILLATPAPVRLQYEIQRQVNGRHDNALGELLWQHDGKSYTARMDVGDFAAGARLQSSEGQLTDNGLEPARFEDKSLSASAAQFDRVAGKLRFGPNAPEADLTLGAQDQLSVFVQLAALFSGNADRLPAGSLLAFQTVGALAPARWAFKVEESELLTIPSAPPIDTVRLTRKPEGEGDDDTLLEVWLAPDIGFLPLRIRLSKSNGDFVDQLWRSSGKP